MTKAAAALGRHEDKDVYDFAYVLLNNNEGGPVSAARHIVGALQTASHRGAGATVVAMLRRLGDVGGLLSPPTVRGLPPRARRLRRHLEFGEHAIDEPVR